VADDKSTAEGAAVSDQPFFAIDRIYVKDISLECPRGLEAFKSWSPTINLDINTKQTQLQEGTHEVVLTLTVRARERESELTYFLVELQQAGLFRTANIAESELRRVLATIAPATLFPYARETIDGLVVKAGFPPLHLAPINFDALLKAAMDNRQSETLQ
jgi:preprotein translocase subunit SecB